MNLNYKKQTTYNPIKMYADNNRLQTIFANKNKEFVAKAFLEAITDKDCDIKKEHILNYFNYIIANKHIKLDQILRKYEITLGEADRAYTDGCFHLLGETSKSRMGDEYDNIIAHFKENAYTSLKYVIERDMQMNISPRIKDLRLNRTEILQVAQSCAKKGDLKILQWILENNDVSSEEMFKNNIFRYAVKYNHLDILKWLNLYYGPTKQEAIYKYYFPLTTAAYEGHLEVLKWLAETFNLKQDDISQFNNITFRWAAQRGHLHILKWLTKEFSLTERDVFMRYTGIWQEAKEHDQDDVCKWLIEQFKLGPGGNPRSLRTVINYTGYNSIVIGLVAKMPRSAQMEFLLATLTAPYYYIDCDLRTLIDELCKNGNTFYNNPDVKILDNLAKIYGIRYKNRDAAIAILKRICSASRVEAAIDHLTRKRIILPVQEMPSIEEIRAHYSNYIIALPDELTKCMAEQFTSK